MILKEIQKIFHKELDVIYGKEEVDSFFYLLMDYYLGLNRLTLVLQPDFVLTKDEDQPLFEALSKLKLNVPIQYIIGETEFYGLPFKVNEHTLIPRPETEELVHWILSKNTAFLNNPLKVLDIGTGTGCIAITLASHFPNGEISAMDVSENALLVAKQNAKLNKVKVSFIEADVLNWKQNSDLWTSEKYDIIISNPPYVRNLEKEEMKKNVLEHEPNLALFVDDDDPLIFYNSIAEFASQNLKANGQLFFEINRYLANDMIQLLTDFHFDAIQMKKDMSGNDRMIMGIKNLD